MYLPVVGMNKSILLAGKTNGKLPTNILRTRPGRAGGAAVTLIIPASRSWSAFEAAAASAGHILKTSAPNSSYRSYDDQKRIFLQRYRLVYKAGVDTKRWEGRIWYLWSGAIAAAPGTSNHGWASAVDCGEENDGDVSAESFDSPTLRWVIANCQRFGYSHELQPEPWHLRYFAGDIILPAVAAYERSSGSSAPAQGDDDVFVLKYMHWSGGMPAVYRVLQGRIPGTTKYNDAVAFWVETPARLQDFEAAGYEFANTARTSVLITPKLQREMQFHTWHPKPT